MIDDIGMLTASSQLRNSGTGGTAIIDELMKFAASDDLESKILSIAPDQAVMVCSDYGAFVQDY